MKNKLFLLVIITSTLSAFSQNGALDASFNATGKLGSTDENANGITTDKDNKILVVGHDRQSTTHNIFVKRYLTNGSLDNSFGTNGRLNIDLNNDYDYGRCIKALDNGKYLISGQNSVGPYFRPFVMRITSNGLIDSTFGTNGVCLLTASQVNTDAWAFEVSSSGSIYVAGYTNINFVTKSVVWKVNPNGTMNTNFGSSGKTTINVNSNAERLFGIDLYNNRIVGVGTSYDGSMNSGTMVMLDTNGNLNNNFNSSGYLNYAYNNTETRLYDVSITANQIIFVGNYTNDTSANTTALVCSFKLNGTSNTNFGTSGVWTSNSGSISSFGSVVKDCKDNFYAGGYIMVNGLYQFRVGELTSAGALDVTFGTNGYFSSRINNQYDEAIEAIAMSKDSAIVFSGRTNSGAGITTSGIMKLHINDCKISNEVSINTQFKEPSAFYIYPNPTKSGGPLYLKLNTDETPYSELSFDIISFDGKVIYSDLKIYDPASSILPVGTYLSKGIYQVIIKSRTANSVQSFIIE